MISDLRYALRALAAAPGFAAAAVLTLALGIGANTAIFTAVYGVLLKPLPYGEPDRLVRVSETRRGSPWNVSWPNYLDWRARSHAFEEMAIFNTIGRATIAGSSGAPQVFVAGSCETNMFAVMGIAPAAGRLFTPDDAAANAPAVVVITDQAWRAVYGSDPAIVGRTVKLGDDEATLAGVLPPDVRPFDVDVWWPQRPTLLPVMALDRANHPGFGVVARLRRGLAVEDARRDLSAIAASLAREYPASNTDYGVTVRPMIDAVAGSARPMLRALMASVAVLLLIACANVANLLLAKGIRRERETSLRAALGASRAAIVRLFLVEGLLLGALGGVAGLLLAGWGVRLVRGVPGFALPRASEIAIDPHVLGFAVALGLATTALFALAPALQLSRIDLMRALRQSSNAATASGGQARVRWMLVAGEVALLVVLLAGATLMQRSLAKLAAVDLGFDASRLLVVSMQQPRSRYSSTAAISDFAFDLLGDLGRRPGVSGAALAWPFDLTGASWAPNVNRLDRPFTPGREPAVRMAAITPGYFAVMGIPIHRGRDFGSGERLGGPVAAIVNETFVSRVFDGEDPIGRRVATLRIPALADMTIVGVVGDTRRAGVLGGYMPEVYVAFQQFPAVDATVLVRSAADPLLVAGDVRARIAARDRSVAVGTMQRASDAVARTYGDRRALSWLLASFAGLALALTMLGIASVVAFTVAQRTAEIGVRLALGARPEEVVRLIVQGSLAPVLAGAAAGLLALVPLSRLLRSYLFDVSPLDPIALGAAAAVMMVSAALAAWVPARRASRVDPLVALRAP